MADLRHLTDDVAVAGQIGPADLGELAEAGYRSVICNRPDGEAPDEPQFPEIAAAAEQVGLQVRYVPVYHSGLTAEDVAAFRAALDEMPRPLLAYCRSGARSATIFEAARF